MLSCFSSSERLCLYVSVCYSSAFVAYIKFVPVVVIKMFFSILLTFFLCSCEQDSSCLFIFFCAKNMKSHLLHLSFYIKKALVPITDTRAAIRQIFTVLILGLENLIIISYTMYYKYITNRFSHLWFPYLMVVWYLKVNEYWRTRKTFFKLI